MHEIVLDMMKGLQTGKPKTSKNSKHISISTWKVKKNEDKKKFGKSKLSIEIHARTTFIINNWHWLDLFYTYKHFR